MTWHRWVRFNRSEHAGQGDSIWSFVLCHQTIDITIMMYISGVFSGLRSNHGLRKT